MVDKQLFDGYYTIMDNPRTADYDGIRQAYTAARESDHSTQVGAACGVGTGYNKLMYDDHPDVRIHAEVMCLLMNARSGVPTQGRTMYAPWAPCADCAMAIVTAGIARVVVHHQRMQRTPPKWQASVQFGLGLLKQRNVKVEAVDQYLGELVRVGNEEVIL